MTSLEEKWDYREGRPSLFRINRIFCFICRFMNILNNRLRSLVPNFKVFGNSHHPKHIIAWVKSANNLN